VYFLLYNLHSELDEEMLAVMKVVGGGQRDLHFENGSVCQLPHCFLMTW
jgi:hypothetical protein